MTKTQNNEVLNYLKRRKGLTQADAITKFGIYRLASRIYDLRAMGYDIRSFWHEATNRNGNAVRYKEYRLSK